MALRDGDATFEIECEVKAATEKALLIIVTHNKQKREEWVPKSQLSQDSEIGNDSIVGDKGTIEMSEWIAKTKGFI